MTTFCLDYGFQTLQQIASCPKVTCRYFGPPADNGFLQRLGTSVPFSLDLALQKWPKKNNPSDSRRVNSRAIVRSVWSSGLEIYETVPSPVDTSMVCHRNVCLPMASKQPPDYIPDNIAHLPWRQVRWKRLEIAHLQQPKTLSGLLVVKRWLQFFSERSVK